MVLWRFFGSRRRRLRRAERTRVAEFADRSVAKIVGRVRFLESPLTAPLSRRQCVYFESARLSDSEAPGAPRTVIRGQDFLLEDETGIALVRHSRARFLVAREPRNPPPEAYGDQRATGAGADADLDELSGRNQAWRRFDEGYLFEEGLIGDGDEVAVLGYGSLEPDPDAAAATGGYRDTGKQLVMQSTREIELLVGKTDG